MKYIIKRGKRQAEPYDPDKLRSSIIGTCCAVRSPEGEAEKVAALVCADVDHWIANKTEVTTRDLRHAATQVLAKYNKDAAYYYGEQKQII